MRATRCKVQVPETRKTRLFPRAVGTSEHEQDAASTPRRVQQPRNSHRRSRCFNHKLGARVGHPCCRLGAGAAHWRECRSSPPRVTQSAQTI